MHTAAATPLRMIKVMRHDDQRPMCTHSYVRNSLILLKPDSKIVLVYTSAWTKACSKLYLIPRYGLRLHGCAEGSFRSQGRVWRHDVARLEEATRTQLARWFGVLWIRHRWSVMFRTATWTHNLYKIFPCIHQNTTHKTNWVCVIYTPFIFAQSAYTAVRSSPHSRSGSQTLTSLYTVFNYIAVRSARTDPSLSDSLVCRLRACMRHVWPLTTKQTTNSVRGYNCYRLIANWTALVLYLLCYTYLFTRGHLRLMEVGCCCGHRI